MRLSKLIDRRPALTVQANVLAFIGANLALAGRLGCLGVLGSTSRANEIWHD
jgi:hypothetical protein